jgi:hypothetical protein
MFLNIGVSMKNLPLIVLIILSIIGLGVFGTLAMGADIEPISWGGGNGMMGDGNGMMGVGSGMMGYGGGGACPMMNDGDSNYMHYMHEECEEHMDEHGGYMSLEECEELHEECEENMHEYCEHYDESLESTEN